MGLASRGRLRAAGGTLDCSVMMPQSNPTLNAAVGFNDELTMILNQLAISLKLLGPEHPASPNLLDLQRSALRCADISRRLLASSRLAAGSA